MTLQGKVSCSPATDLRGKSFFIMNEDGVLAASVELTEFDGVIDFDLPTAVPEQEADLEG